MGVAPPLILESELLSTVGGLPDGVQGLQRIF
jgi:hypothetical protein